eukprot:4782605-Pleurochrysis_carterae.AAC.2
MAMELRRDRCHTQVTNFRLPNTFTNLQHDKGLLSTRQSQRPSCRAPQTTPSPPSTVFSP